MIKDLSHILERSQALKLAREVVREDNERFRKNHKPRFKTEQELKDYIMTPSKKRQPIFKF